MRTSSPSDGHGRRARAALLWDESFLWGVMALKALDACGLACDLIRSEDVRKGRLPDHSLLLVPGGWASNKLKALGDKGVEEIMRFVHDGGAYLGFCGGAGLATEDGIGLLPVKRRPTMERVPSFSGRIRLTMSDHPLWQGVSEPIFHAWWPSQLLVDKSVSVLATYDVAMPDSFSSDVNIGDAEAGGGWAELERIYQINLDPKRLKHEPAVIEGRFGKGTVLLSLVHFDTPDDGNGATVLKNIWMQHGAGPASDTSGTAASHDAKCAAVPHRSLSELVTAVDGLIDLGLRNFLWFRRNPLLLQWRRGVRGLEYCTLFVLVNEIASLMDKQGFRPEVLELEHRLDLIKTLALPFVERASELLVRERFAMQNAHITYERCDDQRIRDLRDGLFSRAKSHGGAFKEIIDQLDLVLSSLLRKRAVP